MTLGEIVLHPALQPIAFLLGTWRGEGEGRYPTIEDFRYGEELRFWHAGRPVLLYAQRTWSLVDGAPMHSEMGYWRLQPGGRVETAIAHGFGVAEIEEGRVAGTRVEVRTTSLAAASTAKPIAEIARVLEVSDDILSYRVDMAAVGQDLQEHLRATLRRSE